MKVERTPIGLFVIDENSIVKKSFFSKNPDKAVKQFLTKADNHTEVSGFVASKFREIAKDNFVSDEELNEFLSDFSSILSKSKMKGMVGKDKLLLHAINAHDEIERQLNVMNQRLSEWYSLHYPERKISSDDIGRHGRREHLPGFKESTGLDIDELDEKTFKDYAKSIIVLKNEQSNLKRYIKELAKRILPNTSVIIDPMLASRMLSMAGSLEKFSRMTASTIQLMGAEKALFRHLRQQGKSPKYGVIFTDPRIQNADNSKRGKIARILAGKISQAVRIDFYSKRNDSERLMAELKEDLWKVV